MRLSFQIHRTAPAALASVLVGVLAALLAGRAATPGRAAEAARPNLLFVITDDQSAAHVGAYGDTGIRTPNMDRLAREGVRFENAFTACPSCTPSRSAILTGQPIYRLEESGILMGRLQPKFPMWTIQLQRSGYVMANTGKTWGPGILPAAEFPVHPLGKAYNAKRAPAPAGISPIDYAANFQQFLDERPKDQPFAFWLGATEPHQPYEPGLGQKRGKKLSQARLFPCWPDLPEVRDEVLNYSAEIEHVDQQLGRALEALQRAGELDRTLVVFTGDHGNPLPRSKCNMYDSGTRVPLLVRYPEKVKGGRVVTDLVSLADLAPTFLQAAGQPVPPEMIARGLWPLLTSSRAGRVERNRDFVVMAFERHTLSRAGGVGYPMRALRTDEHLYIRNYEPSRWPAGDPDLDARPQGPFGDIDRGAIKQLYLDRRDDPAVRRFYDLAVARRPAEELYDLKKDPDQLHNAAAEPSYAKPLKALAKQLKEHLVKTGDPRQEGRTPWDTYPYSGKPPVIEP
ncbi:MAG: atsA 53 [Armatimonadetes bacterium]|jgi:uncharacterized sulfatase|nr:atsA 53 [Armatimonadota bacterium]